MLDPRNSAIEVKHVFSDLARRLLNVLGHNLISYIICDTMNLSVVIPVYNEEKNIGEIPVERVVDFRLLREVKRELGGK